MCLFGFISIHRTNPVTDIFACLIDHHVSHISQEETRATYNPLLL